MCTQANANVQMPMVICMFVCIYTGSCAFIYEINNWWF